MTIPNVRQALRGLTMRRQFHVIRKVVTDFEAIESVEHTETISVVIHPMSARAISVKPEGQRSWKWLDIWSPIELRIDWTLRDNDGRLYRIMGEHDWAQGGFFHYEMSQMPEMEASGS